MFDRFKRSGHRRERAGQPGRGAGGRPSVDRRALDRAGPPRGHYAPRGGLSRMVGSVARLCSFHPISRTSPVSV